MLGELPWGDSVLLWGEGGLGGIGGFSVRVSRLSDL